MSDLIDRLRGKWEWPPSDIMEEAADEIDRLQAEVERLREALVEIDDLAFYEVDSDKLLPRRIARAALTRIALEEAAKVAIDVFDGKDEICSAEIAAAIRAMIKENT